MENTTWNWSCISLYAILRMSDVSSLVDGLEYTSESNMGLVAESKYKVEYNTMWWNINRKTKNVDGEVLAYTPSGKNPDVSLQAFKYQYIRNRSTIQTCSANMSAMKKLMT